MVLYLNTSESSFLEFALIQDNVVKHEKVKIKEDKNNLIASKLEQFLVKHRVSPFYSKGQSKKALSKIVICSGPGSFTGIRVGMALAQSLSFTLNIPLSPISSKDLEKKKLKDLI